MEFGDLKKITSEAALQLAEVEAAGKKVEAELQRYAVELGREAAKILAKKGANLTPEDMDRLLRLLVLRMILQRDDFVNPLAKSLGAIRELLLGGETREQAPPQVELEP